MVPRARLRRQAEARNTSSSLAFNFF